MGAAIPAVVGIDLPELIRLKPNPSRYIQMLYNLVGIDLPELIRLKHLYDGTSYIFSILSGLICLN